MKKFLEVVFNAAVYRGTSIVIQLTMVSLVFGLATNWRVVAACNALCFAWYVIYHMSAINIRRRNKYRVLKPVVKVYMSHPIRGSKVDDATEAEQMTNSERAKLATNELRKRFPELDIYCPGEAEKFVHLTYANKLLTDGQILGIDCEILKDCDCVFAYAFDASRGMKVEIDFADECNIPTLTFEKLDEAAYGRIRVFIDELIRVKQDIREW